MAEEGPGFVSGSLGHDGQGHAGIDDERSLLTIERRMKIVELVNTHKTASVAEITEWLESSPATVRRDLLWLESQGMLERTRGGAMALNYTPQTALRNTAPSYEQRLAEYPLEKQAIGACAAAQIQDHETIMLDSSSTNHFLLPFLAKKQGLTIITNSLYISKDLMTMAESNPGLTIICTGGTVFLRTHSFIGMLAEQALGQFFVDKAFIGARGISLEHGITSPFLEEIPLKRQMIKSAQQVFVLADHSKFERTFTGLIAPLVVIHTLITDEQADPTIMQQMRSILPNVTVAPRKPQ